MRRSALVILLFLSWGLFAQPYRPLATFQAPYKLNAYAFFDLVRLTGAGVDYRPLKWLEADAQFGIFYTDGIFSKFIRANDYFDYSGFSVSIRPKIYLTPHFYFGFYGAYHNYGYQKHWAVPDNTNDEQAIRLLHLNELRDKHVISYSPFGLTLGWKQYLRTKWTIEEYMLVSGEAGGDVRERIYASTALNWGTQTVTYPYDINYKITRAIHPTYHGYTMILSLAFKVGYNIF